MQDHTDALPFKPPSAASSIRLANLLGSGGSGTVFRAQRTTPMSDSTGPSRTDLVAVKLPNAGLSLVDEAAALQRFLHPNIVELIEDHTSEAHGETAGAIVLELCAGGTLEDLVVRRALSANEVQTFVVAISAALSAIHDAGWIHGDVTPSNIGLRPDATPALFDLGTCRRATGERQDPETMGTEVFSESTIPSTPSFDVRSLAATALWSLGSPMQYSSTDQLVAIGLQRTIARCDDGERLTLDDLTDVFVNVGGPLPILAGSRTTLAMPNLEPVTNRRARAQRPRTRQFGPRPSDHDDRGEPNSSPTTVTTTPSGRVKAAVLCALAAILAFAAIETFNTTSSPASTPIAATPAQRLSAAATLESAQVLWSQSQGSAQVTVEGVTTRFQPGRSGDLAAVGDWDCDGRATLGVFRPRTGAWFTFDSWSANSTSTVEMAAASSPTGDFVIDVDSNGCASPVFAHDPG